MRKVELLAPAGDKESFIGAINAGANAVYVSGKLFGARKFANNFSKEEIREMIKYAHLRNVKVFVTINTLIFDNELKTVFQFSDYLVSCNVDALIVQDLGIISQFVKRYPDTEIHASTQMNAYLVSQVKYLKNIGVKRVILARETSIDTILKIKKEVDIDLEVFVHGALCVSYSGNCLFSFFNGGRSGNKGECAQPCRLTYDLLQDGQVVSKETYIMSTKDLNTLPHIDEIIQSGVMSLKIEGRMKKPEYVIATTKAYRNAIDSYLNHTKFQANTYINDLESVFNREFTKGYILNEKPYDINNSFRPNHLGYKAGTVLSYENGKTKIKLINNVHIKDGYRIIGKSDIGGQLDKIVLNKEAVESAKKGQVITIDLPRAVYKNDSFHITQNSTLEKSLSNYLQENYNLIGMSGQISIYPNKQIEGYVYTDYSDYVSLKSDYIPEPAKNPKQNQEALYNQFNKFGDTPFYLKDFTVNTDGKAFVPNKVLNDFRRELIDNLVTSITNYKLPKINLTHKFTLSVPKTNYLSISLETKEQLLASLETTIDRIYIPEKLKDVSNDKRVMIRSTRIRDVNNQSKLIVDYGDIKQGVSTDSSLNITNHYSIYELHKKGVEVITISEEISIEQIRDMIKGFTEKFKIKPNLERILYNRPTLMITKYCPITKALGINREKCNICEKHDFALQKNNQFYPLFRDFNCNMRVLDSKIYDEIQRLEEYKEIGVNNFRVNVTTETYENTISILQKFINTAKK
jgi:putative protease